MRAIVDRLDMLTGLARSVFDAKATSDPIFKGNSRRALPQLII